MVEVGVLGEGARAEMRRVEGRLGIERASD
jgi:hypothetical protein